MAIVQCPTQNNLPSFQYVINLDGTNYTLTFTYNIRMSKWFLNLADGVGNVIISQVPMVSDWPLFDRFNEAAIPPGTIFPWDTSGQDLDAGQFDLGARVLLYYAEVGTL